MSPGPDYSIDMVKQMAFEREIWNLDLKDLSDEEKVAKSYLQKRLTEINEKYKNY